MANPTQKSKFTLEQVDNAISRLSLIPGSGPLTAADVGAAPAGYGLGAAPKSVSSWDEATVSGWYKGPAPAGFGYGTIWGRVDALKSGYIAQVIYLDANPNCSAMRECINGTWKAWEWVNPPMLTGVEYRTTERYNGKPVYVKIVDCGKMPSATTSTIDPGVENILYRISVEAMMYYSVDDTWTLPLNNGTHDASCWFNNKGINVRSAQTGLSAYTCYATIKYTKKTD